MIVNAFPVTVGEAVIIIGIIILLIIQVRK